MPSITARAAATGIAGLDHIVGGRPPRGAGKTTLSMQFLLAGVPQGERSSYVALSETRSEIVQVADSHGWELTGVDLHELTAAEKGSHEIPKRAVRSARLCR